MCAGCTCSPSTCARRALLAALCDAGPASSRCGLSACSLASALDRGLHVCAGRKTVCAQGFLLPSRSSRFPVRHTLLEVSRLLLCARRRGGGAWPARPARLGDATGWRASAARARTYSELARAPLRRALGLPRGQRRVAGALIFGALCLSARPHRRLSGRRAWSAGLACGTPPEGRIFLGWPAVGFVALTAALRRGS